MREQGKQMETTNINVQRKEINIGRCAVNLTGGAEKHPVDFGVLDPHKRARYAKHPLEQISNQTDIRFWSHLGNSSSRF